MKGDFSRLSFRARKHYSSVLSQQGRVWLDADWNEDVQDRQFLHDQETIDIVGRWGAPEPGTGFQIAPNTTQGAQPDDFLIGGGPGRQGHFYVDGLLCQFEQGVSYLSQPDYPNPTRIGMPTQNAVVTALVYLEAWQRLITYLEDPDVREVALGGPDTAVRLKTVAQVKVIQIPDDASCATAVLPTSGQGTLTTLQSALDTPTDPCRLPDPANFTGRENHLYRVEVHDAGDVLGGSGQAQTVLLGADVAAGAVSLTLPQALNGAQSDALRSSGVVLISDDDGAMDRIPLAGVSADGLSIALRRGVQIPFRAARNARITIGAAHFKWSSNNASFAVSVTAVSADRKTLTVDTLGRDQATALRLGDLVEISDDVSELGPGAGHLTYLSSNPDPDLLTVSLADALPSGFGPADPGSPPNATTPDRHLLVRRWDGLGTAATAFDASTTPDINLGDGVHIQFGGEDLRAGDFWQFQTRAVDGSVQALVNEPPAGVIRRRAALAVVRWTMSQASPAPAPVFEVLEDCRLIFPPLTSLYEPGFHITGVFGVDDNGQETPLDNDSIVEVEQVAGGIHVHCDAPVDVESVSRPTCFLTVESPFGGGDGVPPSAYQPLTVRGSVDAAGQIITWAPTAEGRSFMINLPVTLPEGDPGALARLMLKGNFIWDQANPRRYLDGNVLGVPSGTGTTSLKLPSGDRRRGGDFEMWFWLARQAPPLPLTFVFSANQLNGRADGLTELIGDMLLTGTGGTPTAQGTQVPLVNIQLFFNCAVTSPILQTQQQDAVLLIDDPTQLNTNTAVELTGVGGSGLDFKGGSAPNMFLASQSAPNSILFTNVPLDPPGRNTQRVFRIKNVRLNLSAILGGVAPTPAFANVSITGPIAVPVNPPSVAVATPRQSGVFQVVNPAGGGVFLINPRIGNNMALAADPKSAAGVINVRLAFQEGFANAFRKNVGDPTNPVVGISQSAVEEGFDNQGNGALPVTGPALPTIGHADNGTRFIARFDKVPPGVQIFVTTRDVLFGGPPTDPPKAILIQGTDINGGGGNPGQLSGGVPIGTGGSTEGVPIDTIALTGGTGVAVWEWVSADPAAPQVIDGMLFGILLAMPPTPNAVLGTAVVTLSLAPIGGNVFSTNATSPIPRFLRTSQAQQAFVVSIPLFPFPGGLGKVGIPPLGPIRRG